jgi:hypothetical protein
MARAKTASAKPVEAGSAPKRLLRAKGPLSPSETELVVYAGLNSGHLVETPGSFELKAKAIANLVTDNPALASFLAHKNLIPVEGDADLKLKLMRLQFDGHRAPVSEREAAVAGSQAIIDAALTDAYRVVLFLSDEADQAVPEMFADWKVGKPDKRSSPPTITITRE